ncbi:MAG: hypothetical protein A2Y24_01575 [Clostridiales bacterium GWE2_32_10]|nr:MAG: hypothetical protein A2Y24_01575 [Clostridiales bacterium GWE2_32_10]HBY21432.1 hypothetical protein [Clostridiales bacterium]
MKKLNQKGFTLLELLAVLVIMAALAVIAIPIFLNKGDEAKRQALKANLNEIQNAIQRYEWEAGTQAAGTAGFHGFLDNSNVLITSKYIASAPASPYATTTGYKNFQYCIGVSGGRTVVKLVAVDNEDGTPDGAIIDQGLTNGDTKPTDTTTILSSGTFITNGTVFEVLNTSAVPATGTVTYAAAGSVTVDGTQFTYDAASNVGLKFTSADDLAADINNLVKVAAFNVGGTITVTASTPGTAGNAITLESAGGPTVSGATLAGGADEVANTNFTKTKVMP